MSKRTVGALVAGAALALAPGASAQGGDATLDFQFSTKKSGKAAGFAVAYTWRGEGKPSPMTGIKLSLPGGSKIDADGAPLCTAPREQRVGQGHAAVCPQESLMGGGLARAYAGETLVDDRLELWNVRADRDVLNVENYVAGKRLYAFTGELSRRAIDFKLGGPQRVTEFALDVDRRSARVNGKRVNYLTTPRKCSKKRRWKMVATISYQDGTKKKLTDSVPCKRR